MQSTRMPWGEQTGGTRVRRPASRLPARRGPDRLGSPGQQREQRNVDGRRITLAAEPLSAKAFAPYGDVIERREDSPFHTINRGFARRFDGLATIDTAAGGGTTGVGIVRARPHALPLNVARLERHRLGSQAFVPLSGQAYLVVVAPAA